jgi:NAD(P)-dependent dehydrogenase (short-subunit alcohol dehydrogenase family)
MKLRDKVAIITGAGRGIGKAIALAFAREGADVVVTARTVSEITKTAAQIKALGHRALAIKTDVSSKEDVKVMTNRTIQDFGKVDILVNNAGTFQTGLVVDMLEKDWDNVFNVNLKGTLYCSQLMARQMIKQGSGGKIINIASIDGLLAEVDNGVYCCSKAAIIALTRNLAVELAPYKINVNAIAPGAIETAMSGYNDKIRAAIRERVPWGEIGNPEDVSGGAVYLASEESRYVTGTILVIDGGWSIDATIKVE